MSDLTYTVYKVSGKFSPYSYYGYSYEEDILKAFLRGAHRSGPNDSKRADVRFLEDNGGLDENVWIEEQIDVFDSEVEAWMLRNEIRSTVSDSFTGPTNMPYPDADKVLKEKPELGKRWEKQNKIRLAKTAKEAKINGRWSQEQINNLVNTRKNKKEKDVLTNDYKTLSPDEFAEKYALEDA